MEGERGEAGGASEQEEKRRQAGAGIGKVGV